MGLEWLFLQHLLAKWQVPFLQDMRKEARQEVDHAEKGSREPSDRGLRRQTTLGQSIRVLAHAEQTLSLAWTRPRPHAHW